MWSTAIKVRKSDVAAVVAASFPCYRGRKFRVDCSGRAVLSDLNWGGGTRSQFVALRLIDGARRAVVPAAPWFETRDGAPVDVPEGFVLVEHSIFCGEDLGIVIHANPANAPRLLPAGTEVMVARDTCRPAGDPLAVKGQVATLRGCTRARGGDELAIVDLQRGEGTDPFRTVVPFDALKAK